MSFNERSDYIMRQAIITKYLPATNTKGARIKATPTGDTRGGLTSPYGYELGPNANHAKAAQRMAANYGWSGLFVAGGGQTGNYYVNLGTETFTAKGARRHLPGVEGVDWFYVE